MEEAVLFKIVIAFAATTYSVIFGIMAKKVWDVPSLVRRHLDEYKEGMGKVIESQNKEIGLSHRRHEVTDRLVSRLIRTDYDSKAVAETGIYPKKTRANKEEMES